MSNTTEIIPLGTASAIPTRDRHLSATALVREGEILLFDCGEGTQTQLMKAGLKRSRISVVFISHLHGDHLYGLLGLLSTLGLLRREAPLTVVGPAGLAAFLDAVPRTEHYQNESFPLNLIEIQEDFEHRVVYETPQFRVTARPLDHRMFTVGYRYEETPAGHLKVEYLADVGVVDHTDFQRLKKGKDVKAPDGRTIRPEDALTPGTPRVFAYVTDTRPCRGGVELARGADLLIHEATFTAAFRDRAVETGHSIAAEAAEIAHQAGARKLLLTHFSARFADVQPLVDEARVLFSNVEAANELHRYTLGDL